MLGLEIFTYVISAILLVIPIIDWSASFVLRKVSKDSTSVVLKERFFVAMILSLVSSMNGLLGLNRILGGEFIPQPLPIILLSISLILVSVPNFYWLWLFHKKRLHG